jgi:hypothetical protein
MSEHIHYVTDDTLKPKCCSRSNRFSSTTGPNGAARAR